ncbi:Modification methylase HaeIII [Aurantimicrobium sp. MWH-Uga1]|nr:Modification methylase HaeIII [Aurantimicrobium sp. MWH-Uga1]
MPEVSEASIQVHRLGELFSGPGGLALGAHYAADEVSGHKIQHAWATDYHRDTCDTYVANIPGASPNSVLHQDVRTIDFGELAPIDGLAFGFPCNDFSIVGKQLGTEGKFGPLYKFGVKALQKHQPKWFVAENVGGLRNSNGGEALRQILLELSLAGQGYKLVPHLYKFEKYGVPQARHRILIVGIRADLNTTFRVPSTEPYSDIDVSAGGRISFPPIPAHAPNNDKTAQSKHVIERLKHIKPGENAFTANIPSHLRLNVRGATISQIYKRLEFDKPAYTVTGSGGGGTHVYHWEEPRALTNRERARLQTFPDDFVFLGSKESVRRQIGMAVPVQGAKVIFEALFRSLNGEEFKSVESNLGHLFSATNKQA